jgi:hypothetical protein
MVDYILKPNPLINNGLSERYARVVHRHAYSENDLAEAIANRNMGISKAEALAMLEAQAEIQSQWLIDGCAINMQLMHIHPAIRGSYSDGELPEEVVIKISPSKKLAQKARQITLRHVESSLTMSINSVHDVKSGTSNDRITCGNPVKVSGHCLKIKGELSPTGVEFVCVDKPKTVYPVPARDLIINKPSLLIFTVPPIPADTKVQLRITTQYAGSAILLKTPRSTTFQTELFATHN